MKFHWGCASEYEVDEDEAMEAYAVVLPDGTILAIHIRCGGGTRFEHVADVVKGADVEEAAESLGIPLARKVD